MRIGLINTNGGKDLFFPRRRLFHVRDQVDDTKKNLELHGKNTLDKLPTISKEILSKSKVVLFFKNGDRNFRGLHVTVNSRRFRNFDNLLNELTRITKLPQGVRFIFTPIYGNKIESLNQLLDGHAYVCGSYPKFKKINYVDLPFIYDPNRKRNEIKSYIPIPSNKSTYRLEPSHRKSSISIKPKIVTIVRNSVNRPQKSVRILLNRRTAQTFDQVLNDITEAVGVEGGCVRKLYNIEGKLVQNISELFCDAQIFIAVGNERFRNSDIPNITEDFGLRNKSSLKHVSNISRQRRQQMKSRLEDMDRDKIGTCLKHIVPPLKRVSDINKSKNAEIKPISDKIIENNILILKSTPLPPILSSNSIECATSQIERPNKNITTQTGSNEIKVTNENKLKDDLMPCATSCKGKEIVSANHVLDNGNYLSKSLHLKNRICIDLSDVITRLTDKKGYTSAKEDLKRYIDYKLTSSEDINLFFDVGDILGDGNFAVVKSAKDKKLLDINYALKIIDSSKIIGKSDMLQNEILIQRKSCHPNIVRLIHDFHSPTEIFLAMELITGGDFFDFIAKNIKLEELDASNFTKDICSGLDYLHDRNIVHRDIKPENLMVHVSTDGSISLKIADFGLAQKVTKPIFTVCGTPTYVSPEILKEEGYGIEVDVWAAGVIIYIMLCGFPPFRSPNRRQSELFDLIEKSAFEFLEPYWDDVSGPAKDLIRKVLVADVKKRYTCKDILQHLWVTRTCLNFDRSKTMPIPPSRFNVVAKGVQAIEKMKRGEYLIPSETT